MSLYQRVAETQFGSSALFGSAFFASGLFSGTVAEAATIGAMAAASWFATLPLLKRLVQGIARA